MSIDDDTMIRLKSYFGRDPHEPIEVTEEVFSQWGSTTWTVGEFLILVNNTIKNIPPECRKTAVISLEGDYENTAELKITYKRIQTPDEVAQAVTRGLDYINRKKAEERATYEALKAKFDN